MRNFGMPLLGCCLVLALVSCGGGGSSTPPPPPPVLNVSPSSATVALSGTQQFSATGNGGAPVSATWSVNNVQGGNSTVGTIDSTGKYTAPGSFPSPDMVTVTASSSSGSASATVTVAFPNDNHKAQTPPVIMGTTGGNATDLMVDKSTGNTTCCSGTLGSLVMRGGVTFILSNNHVLFKSDAGSSTDPVQQPGLADNSCDVAGKGGPFTTVSNSIQAATLKPTSNSPGTPGCSTPPVAPLCGPAPSGVDAALAAINSTVDASGKILDLGPAGASSLSPLPPSTIVASPAVGQSVAKSGRSTGLTCSTIQAVGTSVFVDYSQTCGGAVTFRAVFNNEIMINGGSFSASGDSGSLVVTSDTARPVGLLFAGNSTSTTANPMLDVQTAFSGLTIVGGGDHPVSCDPTTTVSSVSTTVGASDARLSVEENARVTAVKEKHENRLLANPAISDVSVGASADNPQEGALIITLRSRTSVPATIDGVRTRVVSAGFTAPRATMDDVNRARITKEAHAARLMSQAGIQGVGIGISDDNPAEPAMVIYVISGVQHPPIPPVIDGLRTRIVEGDRFRAFGWGHETVKPACSKKQPERSPKLPR